LERLTRSGDPLPKGQVMRVTTRLALLAAGIATPVALALPAANGTTTACVIGHGGHCGGLISHQSVPLEIAVAVPISQVGPGTRLVGMTPAFSAREDWVVRPPFSGSSDRVFRWAPRGVRSRLCITASRDVPRSRLTLQRCQLGTVGSSHQIWKPINVIDSGFRVYKNEANGLVMTLHGDFSGAPLQIRSMGLGTGGNKNFKFIHTSP
jgi:hypothetical protein